MNFGARLHELRSERGLTLRQVAERGGPSKDALSYLERGVHKPQPRTVDKIAGALGMDVGELHAELDTDQASAPAPTSYDGLDVHHKHHVPKDRAPEFVKALLLLGADSIEVRQDRYHPAYAVVSGEIRVEQTGTGAHLRVVS